MNIRPFAKFLVLHPRTILVLYTLITIIIGSQATNIYMESDLTSFLPPDDPTVQLWNRIDEEFQIGSIIIIYVEADDIRDPAVLLEMDRVSSSPLVNKFESDKGKHDGIYSVQSVAKLIKEENAKPVGAGTSGGMGTYEIPEDDNLVFSYMSRYTIQEMKGVIIDE